MIPWLSSPASAKQTPPHPQSPIKYQGGAPGKACLPSTTPTDLQFFNETLIVKKRQNSYSLGTNVKLGVFSE